MNNTKEEKTNGPFILVQFPEDSSCFEENNIGYPCCDAEDNGARYVSIDDYIKIFMKEPDPENLYIIVQWPESQELMEKPDFESYSEVVMDKKGLNDFICPAYWVQQSSLK